MVLWKRISISTITAETIFANLVWHIVERWMAHHYIHRIVEEGAVGAKSLVIGTDSDRN